MITFRSHQLLATVSNFALQIFAEQFILSWSDIFFEDISLGVGNFGQVVKATVRKENELLASAVKMLKGVLVLLFFY